MDPGAVPARHGSRVQLVLGTAQFGQRYGTSATPEPPSREMVATILRTAESLGITHLDTARAYGTSEDEIGAAMSAGVAPSMRIVSKVRPLTSLGTNPSAFDVTSAVVTSVRQSLTALRVEKIDTLLLHRANDATIGAGAAVETLELLAGAGRIRHWGISVSTPDELLAALRLPNLTYIQLPFNLLDRRWSQPRLQAALAARPNVHITVRSVLLQGLLTTADLSRWPDVPGVDAAATAQILARLCREMGRRDLLDLCVAYVSAHDWVDSIVFGARRIEQLLTFASAAGQPELTAKDIEHINENLPPGSPELVNPALWPPTRTPSPSPDREALR